MVSMMSKVDKVNKIKAVNLDANSPWLQRRNRDDQSQAEGSFRDILQSNIARRAMRHSAETESGEAAVWEGSGVSQSLFYEKGVDLGFFYNARTNISG